MLRRRSRERGESVLSHPHPNSGKSLGMVISIKALSYPAFGESSSNFKVHLIPYQVITDIPRSTLPPELSIWWRTETYWYPLWKPHGCQADYKCWGSPHDTLVSDRPLARPARACRNTVCGTRGPHGAQRKQPHFWY